MPTGKNSRRREAQPCLNVLCSYMQLPHASENTLRENYKKVVIEEQEGGRIEHHHEYDRADSSVRKAIVETIAKHFRKEKHHRNGLPRWGSLELDFRDAVFDVTVDFRECSFSNTVYFFNAQFRGDLTLFDNCEFIRGRTEFYGATSIRPEHHSKVRISTLTTHLLIVPNSSPRRSHLPDLT